MRTATCFSTTLAVALLSCSLTARADGLSLKPFTQGWSGGFGIFTGVGARQGLSLYHEDNANIDSLQAKPLDLDESSAQFVVDLNLAYSANTDLFFETSSARILREDEVLLFGLRHRLDDQTQLSAAFIPGVMETSAWLDPYQTGAARQETTYTTRGLLLAADQIKGGPLSLYMDLGKLAYEQETSGASAGLSAAEHASLARDLTVQRAGASFALPVSTSSAVVFDMNLTNAKAEGDVNSFDGRGVGLAYYAQGQTINWMLGVDYHTADYLAQSPVFNSTREDETTVYRLGAEFKSPFGLEALSFHLQLVDFDTTSNQDFFDGSTQAIVTGAKYLF